MHEGFELYEQRHNGDLDEYSGDIGLFIGVVRASNLGYH
jgi:hypothetical protein